MTDNRARASLTCALIGDESLTIACGDLWLAAGHAIASVVTRDATVRDWAEAQGLSVHRAPRDLVATIDPEGVDWLFSIANLRLIPEEVLRLPSTGAINFHDGPLPRYAGLNAPAWAVINGETAHGVTWHLIEGGVDEGALLLQSAVEIAPNETAFSLNSKCYAAGMESFAVLLEQLETGSWTPQPQDLVQRSYFARDKRPALAGVIDFSQSAEVIDRLVRGLDFGDYWNPLGRAKLIVDGTLVCVGTARVVTSAQAAAGEVISCTADELVVAAAEGAVALGGLRGVDGVAMDLSGRLLPGTNVGLRPPENWSELEPKLTAQEDHWRRALQSMEPLSVPLAGAAPASESVKTITLDLPSSLSREACVTVVGQTFLRGAGAEAGDLALVMAAAVPGLTSDWCPVRFEIAGEGDVAPLVDDIAAQIARAEQGVGFCRDLALRDPAISTPICPDFAISLGDAHFAQAVATLSLGAAQPKLSYDPARLSAEAAGLLVSRIETAGAAMAAGQVACREVFAMPEAEKVWLEDHATRTDREYDRRITISAAFEAQVQRSPEAPALVFEGTTLSYGALNARANRIAHVLRDMGAGPGVPVGLCTRRGVDMLAGALAILKAGSAYVPLDPGYPADRIAHYITDSAAPIIVLEEDLVASLPSGEAALLRIDSDPRLVTGAASDLPQTAKPDDLAYLIYTSGSTGAPKGVMVSHANVANFFAGMDDRIDFDEGAAWLAVTSLNFDISVLELFWTLARGFKLVLAADDSRTMISNGPAMASDRKIDFNLFYWGNDDGVGPKKYELLLEGARFADAHGFNAVWTPERHFHAFGGPYPNPSVTGAAVAAVTKNLAVRAGSCVAPLHHPARIAEEWAVIDNLTNGRVGLAIASGWQPDDFVLRPENTPPDNKPAMYEAIRQLRQLWQGAPVEFPTKDGTPFAVVTQPRPVSRELPIWVTTAGNPQTWKEAGEIGANVLTHLLGQSVDEVAEKIGIYHDALRGAGHDPADHKVTVMLHTYLADTRAEAEAVAREPMKAYLRSAAGLIKQYAWAFPAFKKPQGATNPFDVDLEGLSTEEMEAILEFAFQRYFNDSGMFGTVEDGLARTEQLKKIGVDEIACLIDYGIDVDAVLAGLKPLAKVLERANAATVLEEDDFSLTAQIRRHGVTHMQCTPSMAQLLLADEAACQALGQLKTLMVGGEALPGTLATALQHHTRATLLNMYGPTETTIWSTTHVVDGPVPDTVPLGRPIANTQVYVLDAAMQPLPVGVPGELWIGGDGVTLGYWQREALTAERFVANPFGEGRLYRTGDLVAWSADGVLRFMGRADHQVKIRGHRIELGEIEARLAEMPEVAQAVVIARDTIGGADLVAYVIAPQGFDAAEARSQLALRLPEIMVPAAIVRLDAFPLTPNKKIDRKALPAPQARRAQAAPPRQRASASQAAIAEVWSRMLGVTDIRGDDSFFALGGHSLLAIQAHREIKQEMGAANLSITDIFRFPTLEGLAAHLDKQGEAQPRAATGADPKPADDTRRTTMSKRRMMRAGRSGTGA